MINLSSLINFANLTNFEIEMVSSVLGSIKKRDIVFFIGSKGAFFQIPISLDS